MTAEVLTMRDLVERDVDLGPLPDDQRAALLEDTGRWRTMLIGLREERAEQLAAMREQLDEYPPRRGGGRLSHEVRLLKAEVRLAGQAVMRVQARITEVNEMRRHHGQDRQAVDQLDRRLAELVVERAITWWESESGQGEGALGEAIDALLAYRKATS